MDHDKRAKGGSSLCEEAKPVKLAKGGGVSMMNMGDDPGMGHKKRAKGGKAVQVYNAAGSEAMKSAEDETPGFTKGGHAKRAAGGMVDGDKAPKRLDMAKRGGHAKRASGGGTPYSSGRNLAEPKMDKDGMGHENAGPA